MALPSNGDEWVTVKPLLVIEKREKACLTTIGTLPSDPPVSLAMWWPLSAVKLDKAEKHVVAVKAWLLRQGSNRNVRVG